MTRSQSLTARAQAIIPGGVNSPARAFLAVGGEPLIFERAEGAYLYDVDGNRYTDYVSTWGANILGHAGPAMLDGVVNAMQNGLGFGASTEVELQLAEKIVELMPSIEMVRMVNSGTEATMSAIRLARGFTGRDKIIKFEGCYHGHADSLLVKAGSGALTHGHPSSPGVPAALTQHTLIAQFNDLHSVEQLFQQHGKDIAAIIVEPVAGNMNCIPPQPGFLEGLRSLCDRSRALLIIDEVMTGFRVALGGAQAHYQVKADITTLGKIIGGGLPVGAFGGRRDIMSHLSPLGAVYQAGTLSGNHVAMTAGLIALTKLASDPSFYDRLHRNTEHLVTGLRERAEQAGIAVTTNFVTGMFGLFFTEQEKVSTYADVMRCDTEMFSKFFKAMLKRGVYFAPAAYEACFLSEAHTSEIIDNTLGVAEQVLNEIKDMK